MYIDNATNASFAVLKEHAENGKPINMGEYLRWYRFRPPRCNQTLAGEEPQ